MATFDQQSFTPVPWDCDYLQTPEGKLFRAFASRPDSQAPGLLMLNPLGEEAKSAFAVLNDLACAAWNAGWSVGRFDYLGTGDSEGDFSETAPSAWLRDARHAIYSFHREVQPVHLFLMGGRLGGNIAAAVASSQDISIRPSALILWEPILDFARYLRHLKWVNRDQDSNGCIDHYGWLMSAKCLNDLPLQLSLNGGMIQCPALLAQIRNGRRLARDYEEFASELPIGSSALTISSRPFWEPIGESHCDELVAATMNWAVQMTVGGMQ